jgi:hypothetical protein
MPTGSIRTPPNASAAPAGLTTCNDTLLATHATRPPRDPAAVRIRFSVVASCVPSNLRQESMNSVRPSWPPSVQVNPARSSGIASSTSPPSAGRRPTSLMDPHPQDQWLWVRLPDTIEGLHQAWPASSTVAAPLAHPAPRSPRREARCQARVASWVARRPRVAKPVRSSAGSARTRRCSAAPAC